MVMIRLICFNKIDSWGIFSSIGSGFAHSFRLDVSSISGGGSGGKSSSSSSSYWYGGGDGSGGDVGSGDGDGGGDGAGVWASGLNSSPNGLVLSNSSIA